MSICSPYIFLLTKTEEVKYVFLSTSEGIGGNNSIALPFEPYYYLLYSWQLFKKENKDSFQDGLSSVSGLLAQTTEFMLVGLES